MSDKIYIDFQGGSHGNFLEFVCNRFLAKIDCASPTPFNTFGASHKKNYLSEQVFQCGHYTTYDRALKDSTVISIHIDTADLLPLQCVSLLRAGDYDIKPEELETNTYHKLNNHNYRWVLDNIMHSFFDAKYFVSAYDAIADPGWPRIASREDFDNLPPWIRDECSKQHGFQWLIFDHDHPDCPRHILREFFKLGFQKPNRHGFMVAQQCQIHVNCHIHPFPYASFYDTDRFLREIDAIAEITGHGNQDRNGLIQLHQEFLDRQPYKDVKKNCDKLVHRMLTNPEIPLPALDVIQEAYIEAMMEKQ